jgi:hypothetical protein
MRRVVLHVTVMVVAAGGVTALVHRPPGDRRDLPNRIPEAAPYVTAEAQIYPPPYEEYWQTQNHPGQCQSCHQRIFDEWNGSMMSNSWRDPVWRAAFLLLSRAVSTHGNCDTPQPPDGSPRATPNPFARPGTCASRFDIGTGVHEVSRPGSLLDGFCSRCHMPTNYIDNVPLRTVHQDPRTGIESAPVDPNFNPTSDNGTGIAFATVDRQLRNTESGKTGIFCAICHSFTATRDTPFHNYPRSGQEYRPAVGTQARSLLVEPDLFAVADPAAPNLGYGIGAGAYRLSAHAIAFPERFGPLASSPGPGLDLNTSQVFRQDIPYQTMEQSKHRGYHQAMFVRAEMCAACHDVTNALPIKNKLGRWVGGFPIERTYTEWASSRYADRPGNRNYDPRFKRDCQSCHMQQEYGQPGTAQTLYRDGHPLPIPSEPVSTGGPARPFFAHHFVGGNAIVPRLIGKDVDRSGNVAPYPELSVFSFSSADHKSPYSRAYWTHLERRGAYAQQARMAWDRLRHVLSLEVEGPARAAAGSAVPISITVANTGSGHDFPTGFPEGRVGWLAVHAYDLATGNQLAIEDRVWRRTFPAGLGDLTTEEMVDPSFPGCHWELPAGSPDPYAVQFKAVASLGDGCPTLDLPYAAPLNLVTNERGLPIDAGGRVIDAGNPTGLPQFRDQDRNGDLFDDAYLRDWRLKPLPHPGAVRKLDRYAVLIPPGTRGPIAVTAAVYYQSVEAVVAMKFLGNLTETNRNMVLEPCVLGGLCDGRTPATEPAVVEGAPPVPMAVRNWLVRLDGAVASSGPPQVGTYPAAGATQVYQDAVVKVFFSRPVHGLDTTTLTLTDAQGAPVPAWVDQIGDGVWGLFPDRILLAAGATYTARLAPGVCALDGGCTERPLVWSFTIAREPDQALGDTGLPRGFSVGPQASFPPLAKQE